MSGAQQRWAREHRKYDLPHLRLRQVATLVASAKPRRVLDIGCATGHLRQLLGDVEYVGCDFAAPDAPPPFEFHLCDLNREPLPAGLQGFDAVVCSGILEYLRSLPGALAQIAACLRPGGTLVCTYVNDRHVYRVLRRAVGLRSPAHRDWYPLLSLDELRALLESNGLEVRATYASTLGLLRSPGVDATVSCDRPATPVTAWSRWLAHQFVIESVRAA
jgi:SAM-dependent methyltransferase